MYIYIFICIRADRRQIGLPCVLLFCQVYPPSNNNIYNRSIIPLRDLIFLSQQGNNATLSLALCTECSRLERVRFGFIFLGSVEKS